MVFRNADLGIHTGQSTMLLALFFAVMTVCPHLANQLSPVSGMLLNIAALAVLILFGCHNPFMFNQSTLVLGYLLLYGYDVTGKSYEMRLVGMAAGAVLTCLVFYRNHRNRVYKKERYRMYCRNLLSLLPGQNGSYVRSCAYRLYFVLQSF